MIGPSVIGRALTALVLVLPLVLTACSSTSQPKAAESAGTASDSDISRARERAKIHTQLGVGYYENGRVGVALEELNVAIQADRTYAPAYNARALVHMELKDYAKAESDFKQALRLDPNSSDAKNNYGMFLCQRGKGQEGIRYFLDALRNPLYETPEVAYKNAGLCARKMGNNQEAEEYFTRALKINPRQPQALYAMAEARNARGDLVAARDFLNRYMKAVESPGAEELWFGARLERRLGDRTAMMSYGNQLRLRFPGAPETKAFLEGRFE
jgi:type IV pilus assembly protein PilF